MSSARLALAAGATGTELGAARAVASRAKKRRRNTGRPLAARVQPRTQKA